MPFNRSGLTAAMYKNYDDLRNLTSKSGDSVCQYVSVYKSESPCPMNCDTVVNKQTNAHMQTTFARYTLNIVNNFFDKITRGQSNLAKAASNVQHTLHAQDSVAVAVPEICNLSQKLKVDYVTPPTPHDLLLHFFFRAQIHLNHPSVIVLL